MKWTSCLFAIALTLSLQAQGEYAVGYFYLKNGQPEKAYKEIRKLADVGFSFYMNMVADMHLKGIGVPADPVLAHVWYSLSAAQDNEVGIHYQQSVERELTQEDLARSQKLVLEYSKLYLEPYVAGWRIR